MTTTIERVTQVYEDLTAPGNFEPSFAMEIALRRAGLLDAAERYHWLRSRDLDTITKGGVFAGLTPDNLVLNGEDLDRAIDAAIKKAQQSCDTCSWKIGLECNQPIDDEQYCLDHERRLYSPRQPDAGSNDQAHDLATVAHLLVAELDAAGTILSDDGRSVTVTVTDTVLRALRKAVEQ